MILQSSLVSLALVFSMAVENDKDFQQGISMYRELEFEEAEPFFLKSEKKKHPKEDLAEIQVWLSLCRAGLGENDDARSRLKKALEFDPAVRLPAFAPPKVRELFAEEKKKMGIKDAPPPPPKEDKAAKEKAAKEKAAKEKAAKEKAAKEKAAADKAAKEKAAADKASAEKAAKAKAAADKASAEKAAKAKAAADKAAKAKAATDKAAADKAAKAKAAADKAAADKIANAKSASEKAAAQKAADERAAAQALADAKAAEERAAAQKAAADQAVVVPPPPEQVDINPEGTVGGEELPKEKGNGLAMGLGIGSGVIGLASGVASTFFFLDLLKIDGQIQLIDEQLRSSPQDDPARSRLIEEREASQAAGIGDLVLGSLFGVLTVAGLTASGIFLADAFGSE